MDKQIHSTGAPEFLPAQSGNALPDIELTEVDGEPRARDLDIAERLGFDRPRDIRKLIERNLPEIESFGVCATVARTPAERGGRPATEYWLTEEQALLISSRSDAENAPAVRRMLIKVFVAWRRGHLAPTQALTPAEMLFEQARMMVEVERKQAALEVVQAEQSKRIATTERRLDQIETATDHFTCLGYARWAKQTSINLKDAADLGRRATKRCRELGMPISKIPDPRFGSVNQFPKAILDEAWDEKFGAAS